jgi:alkanesulfonate monooxygenase SsuD/methylene tetrahydromethanopterin reductase-like flavin-dependent oxidoreductase (luciferase family)
MKFYFFHLMPYPDLPRDYEGPAWVKCPNSFYDPAKGTSLYNRYLDELVHADALGFDGVVVNEHHANAYGNMPSPNLIGSILARITKRCRIAIVGNALPLYDPPTRVAEEYAMIDVISGGRLIAGMVVGGGPEYYSNGLNPTYARERFYEAHDLILKAWTTDGPFVFNGKHYRIRYVNPWPKPLQKPHPPIWIPGVGSVETMEFVARRGYAYMGIPYFHRRVFKKNFDLFHEICEREGGGASPEKAGWLTPIYVAETDAEARREYEPHLFYFIKKLLPGLQISPPGYTTAKSALRVLRTFGDFMLSVDTWDQVESGAYAIVGSPKTVAQKIIELVREFRVGNILGLLQLGSLPADLTRKNMDLYMREVVPILRRELDEAPARRSSAAEHAAV